MRLPKTLSFTALKQWGSSRDEFYADRLAEFRGPRAPQGRPASGGSAFDVNVKAALALDLFGYCPDNLAPENVFNKQVEELHRDWARTTGEHALAAYRLSGAYQALLELLEQSENVQFEYHAEGIVGGVPWFGKPDIGCSFKGVSVIGDWKLKGYCSSASPTKGYMICRDGFLGKASRSQNKSHKEFKPFTWNGLPINQCYLNDVSWDYAAQLTIYSWLAGVEPGSEDYVTQIEELCCAPGESAPKIRVATHRARISRTFQLDLLDMAQQCWSAIQSGYIFQHLSRAESDARCLVLEDVARQRNLPRLKVASRDQQLATIRESYAIAA